ncbi:MAG: DUF4440 domain-containing protein [Acidobacteriota bacterium]
MNEIEEVLAELEKREPIFHRLELGTTRADFERMMNESFREVGVSGRPCSRELVLEELEKRNAHPVEDLWEKRGFECVEIAADNDLLTYTLIRGPRITRRATIWRRTTEGWKIAYHQGMLVAME